MVKSAIIRIGIILLAFVITTACAVYLTATSDLKIKSDKDFQQRTKRFSSEAQAESVPENAPDLEGNQSQNLSNSETSSEATSHERETGSTKDKGTEKESERVEDVFFQIIEEIPMQIIVESPPNPRKPVSSSSQVSSAQESSSEISSQKPQEPVVSDPTITMEENFRLAQAITKEYGIPILIVDQESVEWSDRIKTCAKDTNKINFCLKTLQQLFQRVGGDQWKTFSCNEVLLVGTHTGDTTLIYWGKSIIIQTENEISYSSLLDQLYDWFSQSIMGKITFEGVEEFKTMNPPDFAYGMEYPLYVYHENNTSQCYFYSQSSQISLEDDLRTIIKAVLIEDRELLKISRRSELYRKLRLVCIEMKRMCPSLGNNVVIDEIT